MTSQDVVYIRPGSDGDATHRPPAGQYFTEVNPPTMYLEKLATQWMKNQGKTEPGVSYILDRLPAGYALFQKRRPNQPNHVDKWLYGHPHGSRFDSPNRFYPHFEYLMDNGGTSIGCPCSVCSKGGILPPNNQVRVGSKPSASIKSTSSNSHPVLPSAKFAPSAPYQKGRPKTISAGIDTSRVDEEGTPDVYRNLINKLKKHGRVDEAITEPLSMDWRSDQAILPALLKEIEEQPQWMPRVGDIVLYIPKIPDGLELLRDETTGLHAFWDAASGTFTSPVWEAGLVSEVPEEPVDLLDTIHEGNKKFNVSISGLRVEPLPNPNDKNKDLSTRCRYVPMNYTRPFFLWQHYLEHTEQENWHPTIRNALTAMSSVALMGRHRFRGEWPEAQIYSHGIYIGSEFITVGDTVRLLPKPDEEECTTILVIKSIRLLLTNLHKSSRNDYDDQRPYGLRAWIHGSAYTADATRMNKEWMTPQNIHTLKSAEGYPQWYPLHSDTKELSVPFHRVLGRLYENDAMQLWLPSTSSLDFGREGVMDARQYARDNDNRIRDSSMAWFWGDSRANALDVQTVNGLQTSKYDGERDVRDSRRKMKLMEGVGGPKVHEAPAGKAIKSLRSFMAPATSLPVRNQAHGEFGHSVSGSGRDAGSGTKRTYIVDVDEDEAEIRKNTRMVDSGQVPSSRQKKAKVVVHVE